MSYQLTTADAATLNLAKAICRRIEETAAPDRIKSAADKAFKALKTIGRWQEDQADAAPKQPQQAQQQPKAGQPQP